MGNDNDMFKILIDVTERTVATLQEIMGSVKDIKDLNKEQKEALAKLLDKLTIVEQMLVEDRIYRHNKSREVSGSMTKALTDLSDVSKAVKSIGDYQLPANTTSVETLSAKFDQAIASNRTVSKVVIAVSGLFAILQIILRLTESASPILK